MYVQHSTFSLVLRDTSVAVILLQMLLVVRISLHSQVINHRSHSVFMLYVHVYVCVFVHDCILKGCEHVILKTIYN